MVDRGRLSRLMAEEKIDLLLASSEKNFGYLSGYVHPFASDYIDVKDTGEPDVYYAGIPRESSKEAFMVQHDNSVFLQERAPWIKDRRLYGIELGVGMSEFDVEAPTRIVSQAVKERGLERSTIGVELDPQYAQARDAIQALVLHRLKSSLPDATFVDGSKVLRDARMVKAPEEIGTIKKAVKASERAFAVAFESARIGMTELEMLRIVKGALAEQDAMHAHTLVEFFPSKVEYTHGKYMANATENRLRSGDIIGMDMGGAVDYYPADMIRNKLVGRATQGLSEEWVRLYPTVLEANEAIKVAARPGVRASELFAVGQKILTGTGLKMMFESVGHGVGLSVHEYPFLNQKGSTVLEPGMVLSIEPAISLQGLSLVIIEDMIHITDGGNEPLSTMSRDL